MNSLQHTLNHSISISDEKVVPKIKKDCPKSTLLKLCPLGCSLVFLVHQFFLYSKHISIGDRKSNT